MRKSFLIIGICILALTALASLSFASGRGIVTDIDGTPIPNAEVKAIQWALKGTKIGRVFTDSRGRFDFTTMDPSESYVAYLVLAKGYCFGRGSANLTDKTQEANITLYPEQKLKGKVVDAQGKPIYGVKLTVERVHAYDGLGHSVDFNLPANEISLSEAMTSPDGTFCLDYLPNPSPIKYSEVVVSVRKQGMALVTQTIQQGQLSNELTITLPRECVLAGTLYLPNKAGTASEGLPLLLNPVGGGIHERREFTVGKGGRFLISQLAPGKYRLTTGPGYMYSTYRGDGNSDLQILVPQQPDWVISAVDIEIGPDEAKVIDVVAERGAVIKGKVLSKDDDSPVKNAVVTAVHAGRPEGIVPTCVVTDAKGDFTLRVAPGDVKLSVSSIMWSLQNFPTLQPGEAPVLSFKVAEGEQKTDAVLKVSVSDPSASNEGPDDYDSVREAAAKKPISKDLVLKAGSYPMKWDPEVELFRAMCWMSNMKDEDARKLMTKLPKITSEKAKCLAFEFDSEKDYLLAVLDESHGTGTGYDTVYFDSNRNTDLSDDKPAKLPRQGSFSYTYSEWVPITFYPAKANSRQSYTANVRLEYYQNPSQETIYLQRKGAWRGKIDSNKGQMDCVVPISFDYTFGRHLTRNDVYGSGRADSIYIDTNAFGHVVLGEVHRVQLNSPAKVGDRYYDIDVNKTGDKISVKPSLIKTGTFTVTSSGISAFNAKPIQVDLYNDKGEYAFDLTKGPAVLPAGIYKMDHCVFNLENSKGQKFKLTCLVHDRLVVHPGKQTKVDISGKVSFAIAESASYVTMESEVSNHIYGRIKIGKNATITSFSDEPNYGCGTRFPFKSPKVELIGKDGKILYSATSDNDVQSWLYEGFRVTLPVLQPQECTLRVVADSKTPLGTFTAQKPVLIQEPSYKIAQVMEYKKALEAGDKAKAKMVRESYLKNLITWKLKPGVPYALTNYNYGDYPSRDKLSAIVKLYPEKDYLRANIDVTDAYFATDPYEGKYYRASSLRIFIAPNGTWDDNMSWVIIPRGKNGVPEVQSSKVSSYFSDTSGVKAKYLRTAKGYLVDIEIPWKALRDYNSDWKLMPVGIMLNARTGKDRTQMSLSNTTYVFDNPRGYPGLMAPAKEKPKPVAKKHPSK